MNKTTYIIGFISFFCILQQTANATDKATFNEVADLLQQDTVGMTQAQIKEQFNQPSKLYDGDTGKIWEYDNLYDPEHPENEHNNVCRLYFQQDKVHHVTCNKI